MPTAVDFRFTVLRLVFFPLIKLFEWIEKYIFFVHFLSILEIFNRVVGEDSEILMFLQYFVTQRL